MASDYHIDNVNSKDFASAVEIYSKLNEGGKERIISEWQRGRKIGAIKILRESTSCGLKEAKDAFELFYQRQENDMYYLLDIKRFLKFWEALRHLDEELEIKPIDAPDAVEFLEGLKYLPSNDLSELKQLIDDEIQGRVKKRIEKVIGKKFTF